MDPWTILGWLLVAAIAIPILFVMLMASFGLYRLFSSAISDRINHYKTRNIAPEDGQCWNQNGATLRIGKRHPKGHFTITTGNISWGETDEDWKERVCNRKLFLIK